MKLALACVCSVLATLGFAADKAPKEARAPGDQPPQVISRVPPVYPYDQRRAGLQGEVLLEYVVRSDGRIDNVFVVRSNNPWFERPAIDAVLKWKFKPALKGGKPVNTRMQQPILFQLDGGGENLWHLKKGRAQKDAPPQFQWDDPPVPVSTAFPVYPFEALRDGKNGKTKINFAIDDKGRIASAHVVEATTPEMGQAALAMIDTWRFKPGKKKDGTPCGALVSIEHEFRISGRGDVPVSDNARWLVEQAGKSPSSLVDLKDLDAPPKPLSRRPPVYPTNLLQRGESGTALIEFIINQLGDVEVPRIMSASAPEFGYAAVQAIATWRFEPVRKAGKIVNARVQIPVNFGPKQTPAAAPAGSGG